MRGCASSASKACSETVPAYATLILHYDPLVLTCAQAIDWVREEMKSVQETAG